MPNIAARRILAVILIVFLLIICCIAIRHRVQIDLNGGRPVLSPGDALLAPGMTLQKDFYVRNIGNSPIRYKLYFHRLSGGLADILEITVRSGDTVLYAGTPAELTKNQVSEADDILTPGQVRDLQILFHFPAHAGNDAQDLFLDFDLSADGMLANEKEFP